MSDLTWLQEQVIGHAIPERIVQLEHVELECRQRIFDKGQVLYERGGPDQRMYCPADTSPPPQPDRRPVRTPESSPASNWAFDPVTTK